VLDSGAEGPWFKSQPRRCRLTVLAWQTVHTHCASVHQAAKLVAAPLRVARVTAGLAESNGSLQPGLLLMSRAGWLPRTGISSGTLRSTVEYGLPLPFSVNSIIKNLKQCIVYFCFFGWCYFFSHKGQEQAMQKRCILSDSPNGSMDETVWHILKLTHQWQQWIGVEPIYDCLPCFKL